MARRRNIYDASYQTPLADFLDQLPEYFLKYEQLKQQNKRYDNEQAYRATRDKESDRRWDATQQEKIKNQRLNTAKVQLTQQLNDANSIPMGSRKDWIGHIRHQYNDFPELLSIIDSRVSSLDPYVKADEKYRIIDADLSELDTLSTDESFGSHFNREEKRNELYASTANLAEGSGTKAMIDNQIAVLDKTLKFEKDNAGKRKPDSDWSREDLEEFNRASNLVTSGNTRAVNIQDEIRKKQAQLDSLGKDVGDITPAVALRKEIAGLTNDYYSLISYEDNEGSVVRGSIDKNREIMKILESRNAFPRLGGTPEILEGGVSGYEPKVKMEEQDVERYILNNPEQGFDAWMDFITNPSEESENKLNSLIEDFNTGEKTASAENIMDAYTIKGDSDFAVVDRAQLPVTDKEESGTNLAESGDEAVPDGVPPMWLEPATEPVEESKTTTVPSVLEPLTARTDASKEAVIKAKEKEAEGVELIPKPLVETGKYNVSDIAKSGSETGKVRQYTGKAFGENLKQLKELRERVPSLEKRGDNYNLKQLLPKISNLENKIRKSIGDYINPDTGQFSNSQYNERIYGRLKEIFPDMQMGEIMNLVRGLSTAKPYSKKVKKTFQSS